MFSARRRRLALPALVLTGGLLLAGCGDGATFSVDGTDVSVNKDGEVKVESSDGNFHGTTGGLPDGFPSDEVPLVDGKVVAGFGADDGDGRGFTTGVEVSGDPSSAFDDAVSKLKAAGYAQESTTDLNGMRMATLTSDTWSVMVTSGTGEQQNLISYVITEEQAPVG